MKNPLLSLMRRFRRSEDGVAAIELALFSPLLALLLLGGYDLARYESIRANVDRVGFSVADVTSQYKELNNDAMALIFKATGASMPSYTSGANGVTILTSVYLDASNVARVKWQCYSSAGSAWKSKFGTEGQVAAVPSGLLADTKDNIMVAEVYYRFDPIFNKFLQGSQTIYIASMYRPRLGSLTTKPTGTACL
ncbi:pilus assembly protein [Hansschlegelia quercus]|uniref:Pilus assembly protein n=1 Tax=Hansschlegelia quercus TaxID=2528245 RepID=A0A4Q9GJ95_9HYPH|nr:pilus assembly protein [Hansschlegelia quercus]TBN54148.1 pilus assembly protein [Hansschlegelia quercus]